MWILYAFGSAMFAGLTSILAKCGIRKTDSNVATAIRTVIVLIFSWIMVFVVGAQSGIRDVSMTTWIFLFLSGAATGASWLCYFKALQIGDVNKVVPIDKSSTILTIVLAFLFLKEEISIPKLICVVLIGIGTYLMITKKETGGEKKSGKSWLFYAVLSAVFASLTSILGKVGIEGVNSNLGTAVRTIVVLIMAWIVVFVTGKQNTIKEIDKKELGRDGFLERTWQWKEEYAGTIENQLKKLGISCDWDRERFTMDEGCNKAVTEVFVKMHEKGYIYKGARIVNWCPVCNTSISDAEVEYQEQAGHFWHIKYPLMNED